MAENVSLVIPGRNVAHVIRQCLDAVFRMPEGKRPAEIIFVDDGSTDDTAAIVAEYRVKYVKGPGAGPGAARNLGWRAAHNAIIWFIDSDCVPEPDALALLLPHLDDPTVGGVGGSYANMCPDSLLACLIHEEILGRHQAMPTEVNFLGSFNVCYRRRILDQVGGFDEQWVNGPGKPGAEDADLAYRVHRAGHRLHFEPQSRVGHFHPTRLSRYLRAQGIHGYWRMNLHWRHPQTGAGDAYSSIVDHVQPPLAMLVLASALAAMVPWSRPYSCWACAVFTGLLLLAQWPMTWRLVRRTRQVRYLTFAAMSFLRSFWRGVGLTVGALATMRAKPAPAS